MKKLLLTTLVCCLFAASSYAAHLAGAEIEYRCIGLRKWEIKLVLYSECGGTPFAGCTTGSQTGCNKIISVSAVDNTINPAGCDKVLSSINVQLTSYKIESLSKADEKVCGASAKNQCNNNGTVVPGTNSPSIEAFYYKGVLDMSANSYAAGNVCSYWQVEMEECCRTGGLNFYLNAIINIHHNSASLKNSSPVFTNPAEFVVCSNQPFVFNIGAVDADQDSLSYKLIKGSASYVSPYNETFPFPLNGGALPHSSYPQPNGPFVVLDSITGDVSFNASNSHPTNVIKGSLVVEVTQWSYDENGVPYIAGITYRDFVLAIRSCPQNNMPVFATAPLLNAGYATHSWQILAGDNLCFTVTAQDDDDGAGPLPSTKLDTTYLSWNSGIVRPGKLAFVPDYDTNNSAQRPREDRWRFCWQTELSDTSKHPYYFTVTANDNNCPNVGRITKSFGVKIIPHAAIKINKTNIGCYGNWKVDVYKKQPAEQNFSYAVMRIARLPNDSAFVSANAYETIASNTNPTGSPMPLLLTNTVNFTQTGKYILSVEIIITGSNMPQFIYDTITVVYRPNPTVTLISSQDSVCITTNTLQLNGTPALGIYKGLGINGSGTINLQDANLVSGVVYTYTYVYADNFGCADSVSKQITIFADPSALVNLMGNLNPLQQSLFQYTTDSILGVNYTWEATGGTIQSSNKNKAIVHWSDSGLVQLKVAATNMCGTKTVTKQLQVVPTAGIQINKTTTGCFGKWTVEVLKKHPAQQDFSEAKLLIASQPNATVFVEASAHQAVAVNPNPSGGAMPILLSKSVNFNQMGKYILRVEIVVTNSTISQYFYDTITVASQPTPLATLTTAKDSICKNATVVLYGNPNGGTYVGLGINNSGQINMSTPTLLVNNSYSYQYIFFDGIGCRDTATKNLFILPDPSVKTAITGNVTPKKQIAQQYSTTQIDNINYTWEVTKGIVQNSNGNTATVLFTDTGAATVKLIPSNGCGASTIVAHVLVMPNVGLATTNSLILFKLYPNPTSKQVFLELETTQSAVRFDLLTSTMREISSQLLLANQGVITHHFSTETLSAGLYFVRITYGNNQKIVKLVVAK